MMKEKSAISSGSISDLTGPEGSKPDPNGAAAHPSGAAEAKFCVDDWLIDPSTNQMVRGEESTKLEPKVMSLLAYLAYRPQQLVTREEIEDNVWAGVVVGYDTVTGAIQKLRKAFGDDARNPRVIETVSKKGYRLLAPVRSHTRLPERVIIGIASHALMESAPDKPSIAVLPFENVSGDPEQEYFADGLAEDIITSLSRYHWFFVIARNSSFAYKGRSVDVKQVAAELGVRYVLEGSVRKAGSRVRVSAQLIDATTGNHIWAERYDRELEDIFTVQDEVTDAIVIAVEPQIDHAERQRARWKPPESLDAWELYQRGRWHLHRVTEADHQEAVSLMEQVTEIDPAFAPAWAYLAYLAVFGHRVGFAEIDAEGLKEAHARVSKAISLDPDDPLGHRVQSAIFQVEGDADAAVAAGEAATRLNPNFADGYYALGRAAMWGLGDAEKALHYFDRSLRLNPRDSFAWRVLANKGSMLRHLGRYDEAIRCCRAACQYSAAHFTPPLHLAATLAQAGQTAEASVQIQIAVEAKPDLTIGLIRRRWSTMHPDILTTLLESLRKAGLPE